MPERLNSLVLVSGAVPARTDQEKACLGRFRGAEVPSGASPETNTPRPGEEFAHLQSLGDTLS